MSNHKKNNSQAAKDSPVASFRPSSAMSNNAIASGSKIPQPINTSPIKAIGMKRLEIEAAITTVSPRAATPDTIYASDTKTPEIKALDISAAEFTFDIPIVFPKSPSPDMTIPLRAVARPARMASNEEIQNIAAGVTSISTSMAAVASSAQDTLALLAQLVESQSALVDEQKALVKEQLVVKELLGGIEKVVEKAVEGCKMEIMEVVKETTAEIKEKVRANRELLLKVLQYVKSMPEAVEVKLVQEFVDEGLYNEFEYGEDNITQIVFSQGSGIWEFAGDGDEVYGGGKGIADAVKVVKGIVQAAMGGDMGNVKGILQAGRGNGGGGFCAVM